MEGITDLLCDSPRTFIITVVLLIVGIRYWLSSEKGRKYRLPPGPFSLPLVGTLPFLGTDIREPLRKLSSTYGDVFTVYFGSRRVIVLNSYEAIKEAFVKNANAFTGRPQDLFFVKYIQEGKGVVSNEGQAWKEQRKISHNILRDFGVGSTYMEQRIQDEAHHLMNAVSKHVNKSMDPGELITPAVANVVFSLCYEHRRDYDNPEFVLYLDIMEKSFKLVGNAGVLTAFPFLRLLPGDPTGFKALMKTVDFMKKEYERFVKEHIATYQDGIVRDFVDGYLKAMYAEKAKGNKTELCEKQLEAVLGDLFGAGTETTTNTLRWGLMYMLHYPEIQQKIQDEIDRVIGRDTPCMAHKQSMPYTEACIQEIQRMGDIVPLGVPHSTLEDVDIGGYEIPKDTMVISNLYSVHYNENLWPNPRKFDPTRFLDEDGNIHRREKLIPFSMGKRICLGESLARMELFIFFVSLLQNFTFKVPEGASLPSVKGHVAITNVPRPYSVIPVPRA